MENILNKLTKEEKEKLLSLCYDCKVYQNMESEAKEAKETAKKKIKEILDPYGYNGKEKIDIYTIDYKEQKKRIADTQKMKYNGIYMEYTKEDITKPLTIR